MYEKLKELEKESFSKIEKKAKRLYTNEKGVMEAEFEYGIKMVYVEGGEFLMGTKENDNFAEDNEKPPHRVWLNSFWIGKYPVTFEQYDIFCKENEKKLISDEGWGRGKRPVFKVSWVDALKFSCWLNEKFDLFFTLPTEAEWEYAERGGKLSKGYKYAGSNELNEISWNWKNSGDKPLEGEWEWQKIRDNNCKTHEVGQKNPNELGIYDMIGNVWEWCYDIYGKVFYSISPYINPEGALIGDFRVLRGGSWSSDLGYLRITNRGKGYPHDINDYPGFRLKLAI
jgi:formylglycine-generating enzyme required for sulfatase activity